MTIALISMIREPWGGSEELWADMARHALQKNITVIHSTFDFGITAPKEDRLVEQGLLPIRRRGYIKPGTPMPVRILRKTFMWIVNFFENPFNAVFKLKPNHVVYTGTCYSIVKEKYLLQVLKRTNTPYSIIGQLSRDDGKDITDQDAVQLKKIYSDAKYVFFVSQRALQIAKKRTKSNISNAIVVRNPVNMPSQESIAYPTGKAIQLAMVGNLRIIHKGQDIVLNILSKKKWKDRIWYLNIYGSGEDEALLHNIIEQQQLQTRVSFHGKVTDIRELWKQNHALLMPSLMEGMPLAVVEAMLCGRPSVVTDVGGHTEWIEEGKEGWIAELPTVDSFEAAMERAWQQKDSWEQVGLQAHAKAKKLYDPQPGKTLLNYIIKSLDN